MRRVLTLCAFVAVAAAAAAARSPIQPAGGGPDAVYQAIRTDDLSRLKQLVTSKEAANARDPFGDTLLMQAAIAGSPPSMAFLIDAGADVNAQNPFGTTALIMSATQLEKVRLLLDRGAAPDTPSKQGRTPLLVAAASDGAAPIVKLLASRGADLKVRDAFQVTTLTAAAYANDLETMGLLLDAGVDVNAPTVTGVTPLLGAAYNRNTAAVRLLLSKGAKVNAVAKEPTLFPGFAPKSGPLALADVTPLLAAASGGSPDLIAALLDAGADINARDGRGMTPLMLAVATNHQDPAAIRLLLARGADVSVQSKAGETAADWARKLAWPAGLDLLKASTPAPPAAAENAPARVDAKTAAERGLALLETSSQKFFDGSGCVSCHHQNATSLASAEMRGKGLRFDPKATAARVDMLKSGPPPPLLLERMDINVPEILAFSMAALAADSVPPNPVTDMVAANLAAAQALDGSWGAQNGLGDRPPTEEGAITRVAMCIRALTVYGAPGRAVETNARLTKARDWLRAAKPITSEDRNMQLLGLHWAGAAAATLKPLGAAILARQQKDGGWSQHAGLATDAYATGQSLYVVAKAAGIAAADPGYQRGVSYLLSRQNENGSWRVTSRAPKFQAYFNSGFPYAGDQWISSWATSWATMALAQAVPATATRSGY